MDRLLKCIQEYQKLCNVKYKIELYTGKSKKSLTLQFSLKDFLHLSGISKITSNSIVDRFRHNSEGFCNYFLNNSKNPKVIIEGTNLIQQSTSTVINDVNGTTKQYFVIDRIEELTKLFMYLTNADYNKRSKTNDTKIYSWLNNSSKGHRPHYSQIPADAMISFDRINGLGEKTGEDVCFFITESSKGIFVPVSLFPINISFSHDQSIHEKQYEFISVVEITPAKTTVLFECSNERMLEINDQINLHFLEDEMSELKQKRKSFVSKPKSNNEKKYKRKISFLVDKIKDTKFKTPMIIQIIQSLIDQKNDPNNEIYKPYIEQELPLFKKAAEERGIDTSIFKAQAMPDGTIKVSSQVSLLGILAEMAEDFKKMIHSVSKSIAKAFSPRKKKAQRSVLQTHKTKTKQQSSSKPKTSSTKQHSSSKQKSTTPQQHSDSMTQTPITDTKSVPQQQRQEPFYPGRNAILSYKPSSKRQEPESSRNKSKHNHRNNNNIE